MEKGIMERRGEIIELIEKQQKAKVEWIATILRIDADELRNHASELGLVLVDDSLSLPVISNQDEEASDSSINNVINNQTTQRTKSRSSFNITKKQVGAFFGIACSLSTLGISIWMMQISLVILIPFWRHEYFRFFIQALATEFYLLFFGFLISLISIISIIFFINRIIK